jgi:hypothetical protein
MTCADPGQFGRRAGASLIIIGKSLGHKSHEATQIHAHLDTDPVRESVVTATSAMIAAGRGKKAGIAPIEKKKRKAARHRGRRHRLHHASPCITLISIA